ncbi:MAG TPA: hypothetical protein VIV11_36710 [Kofleriaceae bacterium]
MTTISTAELTTVMGGIRGQSGAQITERKKNLCQSPNPTVARQHYDEMVSRMGTGVWPRTVKAVGELCGWPVPEGAQSARPVPGAAT